MKPFVLRMARIVVSFVLVFSLFGLTDAGSSRPKLSISVRDGIYDGLDVLDPILEWENSQSLGGSNLNVSYGIQTAVRPTTDIQSLPRKIWGMVQTNNNNRWGVSVRAEVNGQDYTNANVDLNVTNEKDDVSFHVSANAAKNIEKMIAIRTIEATKGFDQTKNGGRVTITPRFNIPTKERDVMIQYTLAKTNLKLIASLNSANNHQIVTISQQIDANNRIAPTLDSQGNVAVEWERTISEDSTLTANIDAQQLSLQWRDAAWKTHIRIPIDGSHSIHGANVSIQRDVSF